jgi:hypothetical protein
MKLKHLSALVLALMLITAMPALAAGDYTIGQFLQEFARVKNLNATDARIAADSLRSAGVRLPARLDTNASLTEGAVVEIASAAGLRVSTNSPDARFDQDQVDSFFSAFGEELGGNQLEEEGTISRKVPSFDPHSKGKAYAKGHRTPTEPE